MSAPKIKLLRLAPVLLLTGGSRTTHYSRIHEGLMTKPVSIGVNSVAWPEHEIQAILTARVAGKSDDEIRALVSKLMADRKTMCAEVAA